MTNSIKRDENILHETKDTQSNNNIHTRKKQKQSKFTKKDCSLFYPPHPTLITNRSGGTRQAAKSFSVYACHAKKRLLVELLQCCDLRQVSGSAAHPPSASMQTQREMSNESLVHMQSCRKVGGKRGRKRGERTELVKRERQQERKRNINKSDEHGQKQCDKERKREKKKKKRGSPPPPSGCWKNSLCEGYLSIKMRLSRGKTKEKVNAPVAKKAKKKALDVGQRSTWGQHEVRVWREVRRRKSRAARLQMTCPEKHREDKIHREWKHISQKDIQCTNINPQQTQTTEHATTGRKNLEPKKSL